MKVHSLSSSLNGSQETRNSTDNQPGRAPRKPLPRWAKRTLVTLLIVVPILYEVRTSAVQSWILSSFAQKMSYHVEPGPSSSIVFPKYGPFNIRAGYALIPEFVRRLREAGFDITAQARFSPVLRRAVRWGILPPYPEPASTRLNIYGVDNQALFRAPVVGEYFNSFQDIPPLAVRSLLVIENRELEEPSDYRTNPVVDWERLAKAAIFYAGNKLGLPLPVQGGSTLATQMEKYRHSSEGRTDTVLAKLRQMTDASLKVYQKGPDTREERRQIVLDYFNTIPLAAAPGYGELHGLGNGLNAWFGLTLHDVQKSLALPDGNPEKTRALKCVLALLCSVKAPTYYLTQNRAALDERVNFFVRLLAKIQVIHPEFSGQVEAQPIIFSVRPPQIVVTPYAERKAVNEIRSKLVRLLGLPSLYELDRLHLDVESTIHRETQNSAISLFNRLHDPKFLDSAGLRGPRLLESGDPEKVIYGMMLFEKTARGNMLRVVTDNLNAPFDINTGMKMQLGSTAKLRVLVHYMDLVSSLHAQLQGLDAAGLRRRAEAARDPITLWAAETLSRNRADLSAFLELALDRKYSANPAEGFFTGGGMHSFENFDPKHAGRIMTVREATQFSVNLVYIRLMRDIVRYYEARLPYDAQAILSDINNPIRLKMLREIADGESRYFLNQAYREMRKLPAQEIIARLLGRNARSERHLSILFYAWNAGGSEEALGRYLQKYLGPTTPELVGKMTKAYGNPNLNLSDYGYLLGIHPLRVWCAGRLAKAPATTWDKIWNDSTGARRISDAWLFKTRNRAAQDLRLHTRFEQDAFTLITPEWKKFGFPFDKLVPSLATAIGSSGDRPEALAQLMGMLVNEGEMKPAVRVTRLHFAGNTPYETTLEPPVAKSTRVLAPQAARAILPVLAKVVEGGTAARLAGAFKVGDKVLTVGGKTGSGDNRREQYGRRGQVIASHPTDRTAVFVFYIADRYYGVMTVFVPGEEAGDYTFTSSLPVAILRSLAPDILHLWPQPAKAPSKEVAQAVFNAGARGQNADAR